MGRRRRRRSSGGLSRRRFLAGGLLAAGGASILGGTQAFSQVDATRAASIQTAGDEDALLGVDPVASVKTNVDDQELVTLTNNVDRSLSVDISLEDPSKGSLSTTSVPLASGESRPIDVSVDSDAPLGTDALSFSVNAHDEQGLSVSLTRAVDVTQGPELKQQIYDQSRNTNASYQISYRVLNVDNFDRIEIDVSNLDDGDEGGSFTETSPEQMISYPGGGDSDGGHAQDLYEFTYTVYDASGPVSSLQKTVQDVADGTDPDGDDMGGPNDSTLESFTLHDNTSGQNVLFDLEYEVTATDSFQHVRVTFDNQDNNWSDREETNESEPEGTVSYDEWPDSATYDISVEVINGSGVPVQSQTITHEAGSSSSVIWPE